MTKREGVIFFHSETGTEGGYWAFQDEQFIHGPVEKCPWTGPEHSVTCPAARGNWQGRTRPEHWSYEGLVILKDGHYLIIKYPSLHKDYGKVAWEGNIELKQHEIFTEDAFGMWIHADQVGVDRETWARMFLEQWPAVLESNDN